MNGALARNSDPQTSHDAAHSVNVSEVEREVLACITRNGARGATWDEIADQTGLNKSSVSPRFKQLRAKGLICNSGLTRPGDMGREQIVWEATGLGRAMVEIS